MSIDDRDVVARLRAGADRVEEHEFDAGQVVAGSRRALRRRRTWQAAGTCATAAAVAFSLVLVGPVPVPGVGDVTLPGSEQLRELLGLEADTTTCAVEDDLTVEWGSTSSRTVPVQAVGHVIEDGAAVRSATFGNESLPTGEVSARERLLPDVQLRLPVLGAMHGFDFTADIEDEHDSLADVDTEDRADGAYVWWTARELGSLSGVARCGDLPVTVDGDTAAEFTVTSWGDASGGVVDCGNPPERPTLVERDALTDCEYLD